MITLTSQVAPDGDQDQAARDLVRAWQLITKRYKREFDESRFPYFAVVEETKQGWPHLHILCRATFIDHKWLSTQLREITGSYVVWLTRLKSANKGAWYVSKYLGKDPHAYEGCKRYWRSQDWIVDRATWDEEHQKQKGEWTRTEAPLHRVIERFKRSGFHHFWWSDDHVLFFPGTDYSADPDGVFRWHVTPEDRRRMQQVR